MYSRAYLPTYLPTYIKPSPKPPIHPPHISRTPPNHAEPHPSRPSAPPCLPPRTLLLRTTQQRRSTRLLYASMYIHVKQAHRTAYRTRQAPRYIYARHRSDHHLVQVLETPRGGVLGGWRGDTSGDRYLGGIGGGEGRVRGT
jgi:hypothetical protein